MALLIDPEQMALYGPSFIAGGVGVFGTLLGVALGLFGERWVRTRGKVRCDIRWWASLRKELVDAPGGLEVKLEGQISCWGEMLFHIDLWSREQPVETAKMS